MNHPQLNASLGLIPDSRTKLISQITSLGILGIATLATSPLLAQVNLATIQDILGDPEDVFIEEQVAQENDDATLGEEIRTEQARTQLAFNNGAAGRMDENSAITVGQCIEVEQGAVVASGPANGCIAGFTVGVEGTIYIMSADEEGVGAINVLEGQVRLTPTDDPDAAEPILIDAGQKITRLTRGAVLQDLLIEQISQEEYEDFITGPLFRGYQGVLPGQEKLRDVCNGLFRRRCVAVGSEPLRREPRPIPQPAPDQPAPKPEVENPIEEGTPVRGLW
ncbi:MAG: hypothetical protein ACFBSC_21665 [Microcoleaceae cyanobacterium]